MKIYSQNNEQQIIVNYFGADFNGTCLSLGENDGKTLSNVYACILRGWNGTLVEASKNTFEKLKETHLGDDNVCLINYAIGAKNETMVFHESGELLGKGDKSLVSTIDKSELARWKNIEFTTHTVECIDFKTLLKKSVYKTFDLISIDIEGMDYIVLSQMDLTALKCKMLIVEFNGKEKQKYVDYCAKYGMRLMTENMENLFFK